MCVCACVLCRLRVVGHLGLACAGVRDVHGGAQLAAAYPQYNARIVRQYAESVALQPDTEEVADDEKIIAARLAAAKARAAS